MRPFVRARACMGAHLSIDDESRFYHVSLLTESDCLLDALKRYILHGCHHCATVSDCTSSTKDPVCSMCKEKDTFVKAECIVAYKSVSRCVEESESAVMRFHPGKELLCWLRWR